MDLFSNYCKYTTRLASAKHSLSEYSPSLGESLFRTRAPNSALSFRVRLSTTLLSNIPCCIFPAAAPSPDLSQDFQFLVQLSQRDLALFVNGSPCPASIKSIDPGYRWDGLLQGPFFPERVLSTSTPGSSPFRPTYHKITPIFHTTIAMAKMQVCHQQQITSGNQSLLQQT